MADVFVCSGCSASISERALFTQTYTRESCPQCRTVIREGGRSQRDTSAVRLVESVSAIEAWLAESCSVLGLTCERIPDDEKDGVHRWRLTGKLFSHEGALWAGEIVHISDSIPTLAVHLIATEPVFIHEKFADVVRTVTQDHALQGHCRRFSTFGAEGSVASSSWGPVQYLVSNELTPELLRAVAKRLVVAMRDLVVARGQFHA